LNGVRILISGSHVLAVFEDIDDKGFFLRVGDPVFPHPRLPVLLEFDDPVMPGSGGGEDFNHQIRSAVASTYMKAAFFSCITSPRIYNSILLVVRVRVLALLAICTIKGLNVVL
jgi:hypothetical protein